MVHVCPPQGNVLLLGSQMDRLLNAMHGHVMPYALLHDVSPAFLF